MPRIGAASVIPRARFERLWVLVVFLAALFALAPAGARAHAELTISDPAAGSALVSFPAEIVLTFSERVDPALSSITVVGSDGSTVPLGHATIGPDDRHVLSASVEQTDVADGLYTVIWGAFSAEDGHASTGSFTFSVGTGEAPAQVSSARSGTALGVASNWLELAGLVFLTGLSLFMVTADRPSRRGAGSVIAALSFVALVGSFLSLHVQSSRISSGGWAAMTDRATLADLFDTAYGQGWLLRVAALVACLIVGLLVRVRPWQPRKTFAAISVLGLLGLATIALTGHARATGRPWLASGIDWLHMSAASIWLGGLLGLLLVLSAGGDDAGDRSLLRRQGNRFAVAVAILILAGVASAYAQIDGRFQLEHSRYGQILLVKVGLVAALLGIAFYNRHVLLGERPAMRWVPLALGVELALASVVLLLSADLSQTPPANQMLMVQQAARAIELQEVAQAGGSQVSLAGILTGEPSDALTISVLPEEGIQRVIVRTQSGAAAGSSVIGDRFDAAPVADSPGTWVFPAGKLGIAGPWDLDITVRREGLPDETASIGVDTSGLEQRSTGTTADRWGGFRVTSHTALALLLAGLMLVIGLGGLRRMTGLEPAASGFLLAASLLIAGGFVVSAARSVVPVTPDHGLANPVDGSSGALTYAGDLYRQNCAACHGASGQGPGTTSSAHLHGRSADLTGGKATAQSDGDLYHWITNGVAGTEMPAFATALTQEERWQLVAYVRQLQEEARSKEAAE